MAPGIVKALLDPLPEHWFRFYDEHGTEYYYNRVTTVTTYTRPSPLPVGWHEHRDRSTGVLYYWNEWTREVRPYPSEAPSSEKGAQIQVYTPTPPSQPPPWQSSRSSSTSTFGLDRKSRQSQASYASNARDSAARKSIQLGQVATGDL
ncbi:hypothetical protein AB1Y20_021291 [Prymnesium parvum]|uniref:WW domain-containing protein n=1 Tax=Prymnesium parvum TaxID=97485 RepID=A0AB34JKZ5_PRYPA